MSLNQPCHICGKLSMSNVLYFKELIKTDDGKGHYEDRYICDADRADLTKRCIRAVKDSTPKALITNIIHELKESYS
jgi:hypothetical protein